MEGDNQQRAAAPTDASASHGADEGQFPRGAVTFLFTDIESSTKRWDTRPRAMARALDHHNALLIGAVQDAGGIVFKTVGDAICAAFESPSDALAASLAGQRELHAQDWSTFGEGFEPLRVRMGIHSGSAAYRNRDYFGPALNRVARIEAAGHGGQVLMSLATQLLLRDTLEEDVSLRDLGEHRLRDLRHTEHVFQVCAADLPDVRAPLRTESRLSAPDRIVVDEGARARSLGESQRELLAAVLDDERILAMRPEQLREVAGHRPADLTEQRLGRVAEWSLPQHRLDGRFVELEFLVDQGEHTPGGRWRARPERYTNLYALLGAVHDPALVILGPPGSGKSTLLRRLELDTCLAVLHGKRDDEPVTLYAELQHYRPLRPGEPLPVPDEWLPQVWERRFPDLPALDDFMQQGRLLILLDGLNEIPVVDEADFHHAVGMWKDYLHRVLDSGAGNRVVFSCRSLDYSAPLSTPELRVPQITIEPLDDERVRRFLRLYSPLHGREVWHALRDTKQLELLRSPYFLRLLVEQVAESGEIPQGRAALFTGFVRQALRREVERGNPLFAPGPLLSTRDLRRLTHWRWRSGWELPNHGVLLRRLNQLAYAMQLGTEGGTGGHLRADFLDALDLLDHEQSESILRAGTAMAVLDEDALSDEVMFVHQLVQEYFAAQRLAEQPEAVAELVKAPWRSDEVKPSLQEARQRITPADPLPPLPRTGWEETVLLAGAMMDAADDFVSSLATSNLALAGRCASQPGVQLGEATLDALRNDLVARSRDPKADLRARIDAAQALGDLGDPRLEVVEGRDARCLVPPMIALPAGTYPMGHDGGHADEAPQHGVRLAAFALGAFPVTNGAMAAFIEDGGYEDPHWWSDTTAAIAWHRGEGTSEGIRSGLRWWRARYLEDEGLLERREAAGQLDEERSEKWRHRLSLDDAAFESLLREQHPGGKVREPRFWREPAFNHPAYPVVGVCWFEARAYAAWLRHHSGRHFRLPTEAEWEAAARGPEGRRYAYGDEPDPARANTVESHLRCTSPVGVFPGGDTPEGLMDMTGNVFEWTSSLFGASQQHCAFGYPYDPDDGREDPDAGPEINRVSRGGSWYYDKKVCVTWTRATFYPDGRNVSTGFRLAMDV